MKLVMGHVNGVTLDAVHQELVKGCSDIRAAVAYASDRLPLFDPAHCSVPVEFFGRLDGVDPDLLDEILRQGDRITCHLVPRSRNLHAKIIWWRGRGAYVGSANLTDAAWLRNLECGVFYDGDELAGSVGAGLAPLLRSTSKGSGLSSSPTPKLVTELRALHVERASAAEQASRTLAGVESAAAVLPSATTVVDDGDLFESLHVSSRVGPRIYRSPACCLGRRTNKGSRCGTHPASRGPTASSTCTGRRRVRSIWHTKAAGARQVRRASTSGSWRRCSPFTGDIIVHWLRTAEEMSPSPSRLEGLPLARVERGDA